jgi:ABC-type transport system substrate-binding protein
MKRKCFIGVSPLILLIVWFPSGCLLNNPYPAGEHEQDIYYSTFTEEPKHLDPAISYSAGEYRFIGQIYEPPFQYHYLKRPYELIPLTAEFTPKPQYFDADGDLLPDDAPADKVAKAVYEIRIRPGIQYQPHPCFAKDAQGGFLYHTLTADDVDDIYQIRDFPQTGARELIAADYVYQMKRLADPRLSCPILSTMKNYILGLDEYSAALRAAIEAERQKRKAVAGMAYNQAVDERNNPIQLDLDALPFPGVEVVGRYAYRVILKTKYPQFIYWLAMPFFAPMPKEAIDFYNQSVLQERNITIDRFPVGTGPYRLDALIANKEIVLVKNENFHEELYPSEGEPGDQEAGLLVDAGARLPLIPKAVYKLEKEYIPRWNKFLQGYYDASGISEDTFDQAIKFTDTGDPRTSDFIQSRGIVLRTSVRTSTWYMAFNMLDDVVGGYTEEKRKLRQAVSIALDFEEYIEIFENGRGVISHSPIPPGIFGYEPGEVGINRYVYDWDADRGATRKSLDEARRLLAEAGYPGGQDRNGNPLILHFDNYRTGAGATAELNWRRKRLEDIGVTLEVRTTDYNRFREKVQDGNFQILEWGWNADYPDPENFLFLLYGPNSTAKTDGENVANYDSPEFNRLFDQMQNMENSPERLELIRRMKEILQRDAPWVFTYHPVEFGLYHEWLQNGKPNDMANNELKYLRIDGELRAQRRAEWNKPVLFPVVAVVSLLIIGTIPAAVTIWKRERSSSLY